MLTSSLGRNLICLIVSLPAAIMAAEGADAVFAAIRNNDLNAVRRYAADPARRETAGRLGTTPLMYAAAFGSLEAVKILGEAGAAVNAKNAHDATALLYGAWDEARTKCLIEKGAEVNVRSKQGRTPLIVAASVCGNRAAQLLLEKGAAPEGLALTYAAGCNLELTRQLLNKGADPNFRSETPDGLRTPLHAAAAAGQVDIVRLLLSRKVDVNVRSPGAGRVKHGELALQNLTPLMLAVVQGSPELIQTLLDAGADPNRRDGRGMSALMLAVASDTHQLKSVELLLARGADVGIRSEAGETALDWARRTGRTSTIRLLEKHGAKSSAAPAVVAEEAATGTVSIRTAVLRGTNLLQKSALEFFRQSGCPACHHLGTYGLSFKSVRSLIAGPGEEINGEIMRALSSSTAPVGPILLQRIDIGGAADTVSFILAAMAGLEIPADTVSDAGVSYIAGSQQPDGRWHMGGISRPPLEEGDFGRTALAIQVLKAYGWPGRQQEFDERIARARQWLLKAKATSSYMLAEQLLGLTWSGADGATLAKYARRLVAEQRSDGGWAQTKYLSSDAYATGLALRALHESGTAEQWPTAYRKGADYLVRTQRSDGSWHVRGRAVKFQPYFESGFPYGHDQWISNAASAYAVTALAGLTN